MTQLDINYKKLESIDGRTVLFLTICSCLVTFLSTNLWGHALYTFGLFIILCWFGLAKQGATCFAIYIIAIAWMLLDARYKISFPSPLLFSMIYKLLMPAMPAYLLMKIPSGKLTAGLRKLPIPSKIMLVLIVMLRFAPTVIVEFKNVKEAMKIRGFLSSIGSVLRRPLDTMEYAVVPLVFRSLKISDELAASAIVRGIESPCKKESYYVSCIAFADVLLMILCTGVGIACCIM